LLPTDSAEFYAYCFYYYFYFLLFFFSAILKDADLTTMSAKKVRQQIEEKLDVDLTDR
jgi:hypothetical protein